jgi:hypothetical protein
MVRAPAAVHSFALLRTGSLPPAGEGKEHIFKPVAAVKRRRLAAFSD